MKRFLIFAVGIVILGVTFLSQQAEAQVYSEFDTVIVRENAPFQFLEYPDVLPSEDFGLPPSFREDRRNGYYHQAIPLPFQFEYNSEVYNQVWVNINGFIAFTRQGTTPPFVAPDDPTALFQNATSFPSNVIAPFWGDHYYRNATDVFDGFMESEISTYDGGDFFVVQWKDLNINFEQEDDEGNMVHVKSSVANFQVVIYKSTDQFSNQGNIEFCYGPVGGNPDPDAGNTIITKDASVGINGTGGDFLNGLYFMGPDDEDYDPMYARTETTLTNLWPPSGGTDKRIFFRALTRLNIDEWWGDGDADFSKAYGNRHYGMPQNRFVTVNDARIIMRHVVTNIPLDSVRRREAYHADVNHNGRYYYAYVDTTLIDDEGEEYEATLIIRKDIPWRDMNVADNLPVGINSINRVYFQATEYDAAWILHYISGRVPELPWIYDWIKQYGKISNNEKEATAFDISEVKGLGDNEYMLTVNLNGYLDGMLAGKFDLNADIVSVNGNVQTTHEGNTVVFAGTGEFETSTPVLFVTVKSENAQIEVTNARFNDNNIDGFSALLTNVEGQDNDFGLNFKNYPNPFTASTDIFVTIKDAGSYKLEIYDMFGNVVKTLVNGNLSTDTHKFSWNGVDNSGNAVANGVYVYRLTGDDFTATKKMILNK